MVKKILIDCDPGIDDAVALCIALFDPGLEVLAITPVEGNVSAALTSRNVQVLIEQLDPPRYPRFGTASAVDRKPETNGRSLHGSDGLGESGFEVSELHHHHPSEKLVHDVIHCHPGDVTLLTLGPLSNVARALIRDPELASMIGHLIMMGGSVDGIGNVTAPAEFNIYYDPVSARKVFQSPITKTLMPLDVSRQVVFSMDLLDRLPSGDSRAGALLRRIVPFAFKSYRQFLGLERIYLHDVVALMLAVHPELFQTTPMAADVETQGKITRGATIFDRRSIRQWQTNMDVVTGADVPGVIDCILRGLDTAGQRS